MPLPATVDEAYNAVNPEQPLELGSDDPRYVDCSEVRGGADEVSLMANRIRRSAPPNYSKQLFTGHRGCGKSTELFRLKRLLETENYFVAYFDVETDLDIGDLDYPDVLLTVAQQVEKQMREAGIELNPQLLEAVARWFGTTVITEQQGKEVQKTLETEYGLGLEAPILVFAKMLAAFKGEIKNSSQRRVEIRRELERNATQLIQRVNELIDDAQVRLRQNGKSGLVLIVDGLEKVIYRIIEKDTERSSHDLLFIEHGEQLRSPNCHLVFTVPINLIFNRNVGQIFPAYTVLPMIKIAEQHGSPSAAGRRTLRRIIASRMDIGAIFETSALVDKLVTTSGGHVRDLLRLVRYAFDFTDTRVSAEHVQQAIRRLVNEYDYLTQNDDLPRLYEVHLKRQVPTDKPHSLLLYNLLVLEYRNGGRWADVHPAVQATHKFKEFVPAVPAKPRPARAAPAAKRSARQKK